MANEPLVYLRLSPAQARVVNSALAVYEAEDYPDARKHADDLVDRTRSKVHTAMEASGVDP